MSECTWAGMRGDSRRARLAMVSRTAADVLGTVKRTHERPGRPGPRDLGRRTKTGLCKADFAHSEKSLATFRQTARPPAPGLSLLPHLPPMHRVALRTSVRAAALAAAPRVRLFLLFSSFLTNFLGASHPVECSPSRSRSFSLVRNSESRYVFTLIPTEVHR